MSSSETTWHQSEHSEDSSEARKRSSRGLLTTYHFTHLTPIYSPKLVINVGRLRASANEKEMMIPAGVARYQAVLARPSFKRGPPKGYIHAIEQRLRQVESVLGTIIGSSDERAQGVIDDLRGDALARSIIERVDGGPFGSRSQSSRTNDLADEPSSSSTGIIKPLDFAKYDSKARRDSRLTREIVSSNDVDSLDPTLEWQDHLSAQLRGGNIVGPTRMNDPSPNSSSGDSDPLPSLQGLYTIENTQGQGSELGNNENNPPDRSKMSSEAVAVNMPSLEDQDLLIALYFTYVHSVLPVIHRQTFMSEYEASKGYETSFHMGMSTPQSGPLSQDRREGLQLLLLAMCTVACRYTDKEQQLPFEGRLWDADRDYSASVRRILDASYNRSSISTCQALLILAYRAGGVGSLEQSWMFLGMAIRMAQDLGLHRAADQWQRMGVDIFTPSQKQERKQVWWACIIVDKYMSINIGRPVTITDRDFDTELPLDDPSEEYDLWKPYPPVPEKSTYQPAASRTNSCFRAAASLAVIVGCIIDKIYAIRSGSGSKLTNYLRKLEVRLEKWHLALPEYLRFFSSSDKLVPPPHVLCIHIQYWCAVLLLHRKFIPNPRSSQSESNPNDGLQYGDGNASLNSLDVCQGAVNNIATIITAHSENFSMKRSAAYLPAYLFSAGVMHFVTLSVRRSDIQAQVGLQQILLALKEMEIVWPSATRARELLNEARVKLAESLPPPIRGPGRIKRNAENAFGGQDQQEFGPDEVTRTFAVPHPSWTPQSPAQHQVSNLMMAHMLGLEMQPSMSFNIRTHDAWSPTDTQVPSTPTSPVSPTVVSDSASGPMSLLTSTSAMAISQNSPIMNRTLLSDFSQTSSSSSVTTTTGFVAATSSATNFATTSTAAWPREDQWLVETDDRDFILEEYTDEGRSF
ncbi:hypothetical protein BD410DRAFT_836854 [Rickenella mellea]|uniref:Xylanolytic transcriptional activator regulatory domain-containing protein n=1 Tax=Rickenella mellea TaxID=50990 RepID=A0A4Y7QFL2_9AGAM|nr:hypothetical protein BD410DRAFT_836854 [Rickenella mellea]